MSKTSVAFSALIFGFFSALTHAQDYKCIENGKVLFTNIPCNTKQKVKPTSDDDKTAAQIQAEFEQEIADKKATEEKRIADLAKDSELRRIAEEKRVKAVADGPMRAEIGAQIIRDSMRDPDSFRLITAQVINDSGSVCYTYRSKNGFGGYVSGLAVFPASSPIPMLSNEQGFHDIWQKECFLKPSKDYAAAIRMFSL